MPFSVLRRRASGETPRRGSVVLHRLAVATVAGALATSTLAISAPAQAANRVTPGDFTGYGFDQCVTPDQATMDAWLTASPYWSVGVYIAGSNRHCGDDKQVALTPTWISTQLRNGWKVLPITVGPQASCYVNPNKKVRISSRPADGYAAAREQGRLEARDTVVRARRLGITAGSTLWYDLEAFDISNVRCRESALSFLSAWTSTLHRLDYVSGVYSSAASGIRALDDARVATPRRYAMPDRVWIAEWLPADRYRRPPTANPPTLQSTFLRSDGWLPGGRMRQYRGGHDETYGGVRINIDTNYLDLGRGTLPGPTPRFCGGVRVDFPRYARFSYGKRHDQIKAAQCLLTQRGVYDKRIHGFFSKPTVRAVRLFQSRRGLPVSGVLTRSTWTALLSTGATPVSKIGSGGQAVRRVQRSLNASIHAGLPVTGIFDPATTAAVRSYQAERGLPRTGVVAADTWGQLQRGRL